MKCSSDGDYKYMYVQPTEVKKTFMKLKYTYISQIPTHIEPTHLIGLIPFIGIGWASVFKTQLSNDIKSSFENNKYKYFNVSARKKLCCTSSFGGFS